MTMMKVEVRTHYVARRLWGLGCLLGLVCGTAAQTLEECQKAAANHYPLIRRYQLIQQVGQTDIASIDRGWLPQLTAYAQTTWQNRVVELPEALTQMMSRQGYDVQGLASEQYKIGIDATQKLYDGGRAREQKAVRRQQAEVEAAQNEVSLYAVRRQVDELYFGWLLLADKLTLSHDLLQLLASSERKLASMVRQGTAAASDLYALQAESAKAEQQATMLRSQQEALSRMLTIYTGLSITRPVCPDMKEIEASGVMDVELSADLRPELTLLARQKSLADAQAKVLDANLRPTLSAFAQGYYGYPGLNMYRDIMRRTPSLNALVGIRASWNIGALYTLKADRLRLRLQRDMADNQAEAFRVNNRLASTQHREYAAQYRSLQAQDDDIVRLRTLVRKAAESKLDHGIIDIHDLIKVTHDENEAKLQRSMHRIMQMQELYRLRYELNR